MIRVLLDEDLDVRLRLHFGEGVQAETVEYRGWKGLRNGDLLRAITAARADDVFVTTDKGLPKQQNLAAIPFAVVVLRPRRKRLAELLELMPEVRSRLPALRPGDVIEISPPEPPDHERRRSRSPRG